ncbi:MAG: symmetrical bis(5'-nucleosyl)-tetraphosphatase [Pseudomonadota bacterium]
MAVYAIGDVQGCFDELLALFEAIRFSTKHDHVWFTGDLVNRGTQSLEVLRFVKDLGDRAVAVLGNHDLHLLAVAAGAAKLRPKDSFMDVLEAPDRDRLLAWLRRQALLHHDAKLGYTMIHAGLPPQWDLATARACAAEVEQVLRGADPLAFFQQMYGAQPTRWRDDLASWDRWRFITNAFTRLRYCEADGSLALAYKGAQGGQPAGQLPWFDVADRRSANLNILFGHWSTLGRYEGRGVTCLDTGCVWGAALTALRLDDRHWFSVSCEGACEPGED